MKVFGTFMPNMKMIQFLEGTSFKVSNNSTNWERVNYVYSQRYFDIFAKRQIFVIF